jgi:hypothetical protein
LTRVTATDSALAFTNLGGGNQTALPTTAVQFREVPSKDPPQPVATVALLSPNHEGRFIQVGWGTVTMKRISTSLALLEIFLTVWFVLAFLAVLLYAPFWLFGGLSKKRRRPAERAIRFWPLIAALSLLAIIIIFNLASEDVFTRMGNLTPWSAALFVVTLIYALSSLAGVVSLWFASNGEIRKGVRWFSFAVIIPFFIAAIYLAYWGIIGLRTWT